MYEKMYKKLNELDANGAESSKIDAAQASIRRLMTKLNVSIKAIDAISSEIHKVRDTELHPQLTHLIYGYENSTQFHYTSKNTFCFAFLTLKKKKKKPLILSCYPQTDKDVASNREMPPKAI